MEADYTEEEVQLSDPKDFINMHVYRESERKYWTLEIKYHSKISRVKSGFFGRWFSYEGCCAVED